MKKILFIVCVLWSVYSYSQSGYIRLNERRNQLALASDMFNLPAGTTHTLGTGQFPRAGALVYDSTASRRGVYANIGNNIWVKLADTTYTGFATLIDVFLIAGQSNAKGMGSSAVSPSVISGTVYQYNYGAGITIGNDPIGSSTSQSNTGSAWPAFGITYNALTGHKVCFVAAAKNTTSNTAAANTGAGTWDTTGTLFDTSVARLNAAMTYLSANGYTPTFKGILWCQGETDADAINATTITQAAYIAAFRKVIVRYRKQYGSRTPFYIFRTGRVGSNVGAASGYSQIRSAQQTVSDADSLTNIVFYNSIDFFSRVLMNADSVHYSQPGYNEMGRIGAEQVVNSGSYRWQSQGGNVYFTRGNAGIGTSVPAYPLDVVGNSRFTGTVGIGTNPGGNPLSIVTTGSIPFDITGNLSGNYIRNTITNSAAGTNAASGTGWFNDLGSFLQTYVGSSTNGLLADGAIFRSTGAGGLRLAADNGEIGFANSTTTPHSRFKTNAHLLLNTATDEPNKFFIVNGAATIKDTLTLPNVALKPPDSTNLKVAVFDASGNVFKSNWLYAGTGGGGSSDHTALSNLGWTASGHTGTASTFAGFNGSGAAIHPTGTGLLAFSGTTPSYNSTSSSIAGIISDETGSGAMMFGTQPTVTTGMSIAQGTITTDIKGLNVTGAWNNAGVNFSGGIYVDITNTASGGSSNLLDIRLGGAQQFYVNKLGQALVTNGTATAPGWAFRDEPDMGFYRINGNQLGLTYGDAQHVVQINSTGLYLGETASGAPLATEGIFATDGVGSNANGSAMIINSGNSTGTGSSYQSFYTSTAGSSGSSANGLTEKMRITGAGNVGIGTTAPTHALTVNGQVRIAAVTASTNGTDSVVVINGGALKATNTITSGTYTPTITGGANYSSSASISGIYLRVGNVVMVTVSGTVTATAGGSAVVFDFSLPIASNFTAQADGKVTGTANFAGSNETVFGLADATNDRISCSVSTIGNTSARTFVVSGQYEIK